MRQLSEWEQIQERIVFLRGELADVETRLQHWEAVQEPGPVIPQELWVNVYEGEATMYVHRNVAAATATGCSRDDRIGTFRYVLAP